MACEILLRLLSQKDFNLQSHLILHMQHCSEVNLKDKSVYYTMDILREL